MRCSRCHALVPSGLQACPYCRAPLVVQFTDYEAAERRAQDLYAEFRAGRLDEAAYRQALYRLVLRDSQGHYWSFVPGIGWHWHDGRQWLLRDPPASEPGPAARVAASHRTPSAGGAGHGRRRGLVPVFAAGTVLFTCLCVAVAAYASRGLWHSEGSAAVVSTMSPAGDTLIVVSTPVVPPDVDPTAGLSEEQKQVVAAFGWPHAFVIMAVDGPDGGTMRHEQWTYYDGLICYSFVDGVYVTWDTVESAPSSIITTPFRPNQFALGTTVDEAQSAGGVALKPASGIAGLVTGGDVYVAPQLLAGFGDGRLVLVERFAVTPKGGG